MARPRRIPEVVDGVFHLREPSGGPEIAVGSPSWVAWLTDPATRSFSFRSPGGSFTARKELRARGGEYWVPYRKQGGRLHKSYLGKAEGYSREGWKSLGVHRLGLNVWWIAFGVTLLITVAATAIVWATPLASLRVPEIGIADTIIDFLVVLVVFTPTFILTEEIGIRGYLLPKLLPLGTRRALLLSGLVWAAWHLPLFYLTSLFPTGNSLIFVPLVVGTIVAASFLFGYFRIYTGSVWPGSIAHAVHNGLVDTLLAFTATSCPVLVNLYLVGDNGILIVVSTALGAIWVGYMLRRRMNKPQPGGAAPGVAPAAK